MNNIYKLFIYGVIDFFLDLGKYVLIIGIIIFGFWILLMAGSAYASGLTSYFNFNFEDFTNGELNGQEGWTADVGAFTIGEEEDYAYEKGLKIDWQSESYKTAVYDSATLSGTGEESIIWYFKVAESGTAGDIIFRARNEASGGLIYLVAQQQTGTTWRFENSGGTPIFGAFTFEENEWIKITWTVDWTEETDFIEANNLTLGIDLGEYEDLLGESNLTDISYFAIDIYNAKVYMEGFGMGDNSTISLSTPSGQSKDFAFDMIGTFTLSNDSDWEKLGFNFKQVATGADCPVWTQGSGFNDLSNVIYSSPVFSSILGVATSGNFMESIYALPKGNYNCVDCFYIDGFGNRGENLCPDFTVIVSSDILYSEEYPITGYLPTTDCATYWTHFSFGQWASQTTVYSNLCIITDKIFETLGGWLNIESNYLNIMQAVSAGGTMGLAIPTIRGYFQVVDGFFTFPLSTFLLIFVIIEIVIIILKVIRSLFLR